MNGKQATSIGVDSITITPVATPEKQIDWENQFERVLKSARHDGISMAQSLITLGCLIPQMPETSRLGAVEKILDLCQSTDLPYGKSTFHFLDNGLMQSLSPSQRAQIAARLRKSMDESRHFTREATLWGLVRVIPFLHSIHQREYAQSIFSLCGDGTMRHHALEALCSLIFSLSREPRMMLMMFFADELRRENDFLTKYFTLELLKKTSSALPEEPLLQVVDRVAPLIYSTDSDVVRKALDYFVAIMSFIPGGQRYCYIQMLSGLVNDGALREDVIVALDRLVPLLPTDEERACFREILGAQEISISGYFFDTSEGLFEPLYSAYKH